MADSNAKNSRLKIRIISVGFIFGMFYFAVLLRSYQLQILGNAKLNRLVKNQYTTSTVTEPKRGTIYDRNGEVLAMDVMVASIGVHPADMTEDDKAQALPILGKYTGIPNKTITEKLSSEKTFEWIERRIPIEEGDAITSAKINGVQVNHEFRRYYPNKQVAGQLLGAVGYDAKALGGLEMAYDRYLKSDSQLTQAERDARGKLFTLQDDPDLNHDVYLTIDKNIQFFAEAALKENAIKHNVKNGFAIVMDVHTGEILAMANWPEFNPNSYWEYKQDDWKNHAILDTYEPGSTFKAITMGAALNSGKVKSSDKFFCENGAFVVGDHTVKDDENNGWLTAQQVLQVSSNICATKIAFKIGKADFFNFIKSLGFGNKTNIGLAGETSGFVRSANGLRDIELSNMAFGQGVSVTGLQMASAYAAFANGGERLKPYLVNKIVSSKGDTIFSEAPNVVGKIMSDAAAKNLRDMLFTVTQPGGTAVAANIEGYFAGGKTGTAQKVDPKTHAYTHNQFVSSFVGFSPLNDPRIVVYVVYDTPQANGYFGGIVAAPVFKKIATDTLTYLGVAPKPGVLPQFESMQARQIPAKPVAEPQIQRILVLKKQTDWSAIQDALNSDRMPNLEGLSLRAVLKLSHMRKAKLDIEGSGFVVKQTPRPDEKNADLWKLVLSGSM